MLGLKVRALADEHGYPLSRAANRKSRVCCIRCYRAPCCDRCNSLSPSSQRILPFQVTLARSPSLIGESTFALSRCRATLPCNARRFHNSPHLDPRSGAVCW